MIFHDNDGYGWVICVPTFIPFIDEGYNELENLSYRTLYVGELKTTTYSRISLHDFIFFENYGMAIFFYFWFMIENVYVYNKCTKGGDDRVITSIEIGNL